MVNIPSARETRNYNPDSEPIKYFLPCGSPSDRPLNTQPNLRRARMARRLAPHNQMPHSRVMLVSQKHFETDPSKVAKRKAELDELIRDGLISKKEAEEDLKEFDTPFVNLLKMRDTCFFCSAALVIPAVVWHGVVDDDGTDLWLHPKCAKMLAVRILRDVDESEIGKAAADAKLAAWKAEHEER